VPVVERFEDDERQVLFETSALLGAPPEDREPVSA
jgi:hypothetical protein